MIGNFSPHEAFAIGGTNSVRGYEEGAVGSGRSYVVGSGEISFPMVGSQSISHLGTYDIYFSFAWFCIFLITMSSEEFVKAFVYVPAFSNSWLHLLYLQFLKFPNNVFICILFISKE